MLQTNRYRNKRILADYMYIQSQDGGESSWGYTYDTRIVSLHNFVIKDDDSVILSIPKLCIGKRSDRWGSWTAWDYQRVFGFSGDFLFFIETHDSSMDPSDGVYKMKTISVLDWNSFQADVPLEAQLIVLQEYESTSDDNIKEFQEINLKNAVLSLNTEILYEYEYRQNTVEGREILPDFDSKTKQDEMQTIRFDINNFPTCGGATLVSYQDEFRWLIPHPNGVKAAVDRMQTSDSTNDWTTLQPHLAEASTVEQKRIWKHFMRFGTDDVKVEMETLFLQNQWEH